jgi:hypothetical protein
MPNTLKKEAVFVLSLTLALGLPSLAAAPVELVDQSVAGHQRLDDGTILLDFGKVAFGNLEVKAPESLSGDLKFHFGEASKAGRIDRKPPGTVRYARAEASLKGGQTQVIAPPPNERNTTHPKAIRLPEEWGVVLPFRWVEIEGWDGTFDADRVVRRAAYLKAWDDEAADFECSDPMLNRIWDLCKYSIKATTFAGIYVDGDRERIPYEADAYINQLSHYYTDADKQIARDTFDRLTGKPTWPTEWAPHMVFIAYADWMHTGDLKWLGERYEVLKTKMLLERVGPQGWVRSNENQQGIGRRKGIRDIVDWPKGERDGYQFREVNTVVNAFHLRVLRQMSKLATALGKTEDAKTYQNDYAERVKRFHEALWMAGKGAYRDGLGTDHTSAHATFFPLAFGLVPENCRAPAVDFLKTKGMACSVYASQYLMESLFENGAVEYALNLMTAEGDRSWRHMVESDTTITWEAWDQKYKPNQDWNHAWGAAPGNLLPRYVLGVEPLEPGWAKARIAPRPGDLTHARGKVPTAKGPLLVSWQREGDCLHLKTTIPEDMTAELAVPGGEVKALGSGTHKVSFPYASDSDHPETNQARRPPSPRP